jgi:hypothetical protein
MPCPFEGASKEYRSVIYGDQGNPRVALKQWLNSLTAYPMDLKSLLVKRSRGWYGHDHVPDLTKFDDKGFFLATFFS